MRRAGLILALGAMLAGCMTARGPGERFMSDADIDGKDHATCTQLGAARGTSVYVDCRLRLKQSRSSEDSARRIGGAILLSQ